MPTNHVDVPAAELRASPRRWPPPASVSGESMIDDAADSASFWLAERMRGASSCMPSSPVHPLRPAVCRGQSPAGQRGLGPRGSSGGSAARAGATCTLQYRGPAARRRPIHRRNAQVDNAATDCSSPAAQNARPAARERARNRRSVVRPIPETGAPNRCSAWSGSRWGIAIRLLRVLAGSGYTSASLSGATGRTRRALESISQRFVGPQVGVGGDDPDQGLELFGGAAEPLVVDGLAWQVREQIPQMRAGAP